MTIPLWVTVATFGLLDFHTIVLLDALFGDITVFKTIFLPSEIFFETPNNLIFPTLTLALTLLFSIFSVLLNVLSLTFNIYVSPSDKSEMLFLEISLSPILIVVSIFLTPVISISLPFFSQLTSSPPIPWILYNIIFSLLSVVVYSISNFLSPDNFKLTGVFFLLISTVASLFLGTAIPTSIFSDVITYELFSVFDLNFILSLLTQ